mmetsp:Transcript_32440/g.36296  ORF Transcript_32440/g.36296 Transcript_32440/m.36296 type:complete len:403 (-) Transcript_32440:40-1248(-)
MTRNEIAMILLLAGMRYRGNFILTLLTLPLLLSIQRAFGFIVTVQRDSWGRIRPFKNPIRCNISYLSLLPASYSLSSSTFKTSLWNFPRNAQREKKMQETEKGGIVTGRKKKKNKYSKFSKTDKIELDPFEALIKESQQKLQAIEIENQLQLDQPLLPLPPPEASVKLEFPNNKNIDPYDPTTFGYMEIGTIVGAHGVHGWAKVQGSTDFPERLTRAGMPLHLKPARKRAPRKVILASGKFLGDDQFLIQLQGCYDRTASQSLKGSILYYATQQDTVIRKDDDILVSELIGLSVYRTNTDDGVEILIGTVSGVVLAEEMCAIPGLLHDQLEVEVKRNTEDSEHQSLGSPQDLLLIPMVPEIVIKISLEDQLILVDPPSGLLDLTYTREEKIKIKGLLPPALE